MFHYYIDVRTGLSELIILISIDNVLVGPYYAGVLNGVIFCDMVLKGPALCVCL